MKTIFRGFAALLAGPALLGAVTSANAAPVLVVPDARFPAYICAGTSQICNPQKPFPANTQDSYSQSDGTASVSASYSLSPSPNLFATGTASGDANAQAFLDYQYFIGLTGPSGTVPLTVNTAGSATGAAFAFVGIYNFATSANVYSAFAQDGSFNRSDVISITEGVVYEVAVEVQVFANKFPSAPLSGTASVDPYFQFPVGYDLIISSGVGNAPVSTTPLPAALPLFAGGLGALGLLSWRRKRKAAPLAA